VSDRDELGKLGAAIARRWRSPTLAADPTALEKLSSEV
jgi:hypothetical protein